MNVEEEKEDVLTLASILMVVTDVLVEKDIHSQRTRNLVAVRN